MADQITPDRLFADTPDGRPILPVVTDDDRTRLRRVPTPMASPVEQVEVNYLGEVAALLADAKRLRKHAMRINPRTGEEEIFNPLMFEKAIARRQSILNGVVRLQREILDIKAQQDFFRMIIEVIAETDKATAHRLIDALKRARNPLAQEFGKDVSSN